jgi:hypothetical protein
MPVHGIGISGIIPLPGNLITTCSRFSSNDQNGPNFYHHVQLNIWDVVVVELQRVQSQAAVKAMAGAARVVATE